MKLSRDQVAYNERNGRYNVSLTNFVTTRYPEESFDIIYSIGAWEHLGLTPPDPAAAPGLSGPGTLFDEESGR